MVRESSIGIFVRSICLNSLNNSLDTLRFSLIADVQNALYLSIYLISNNANIIEPI